MKKRDIEALSKLTSSSLEKLSNGVKVNTDILVKICKALNCDVSNIMENLPGIEGEAKEYPKG